MGETKFGFKAVINEYGIKSFLIDSLIPLSISSVLCIIINIYDVNIHTQLLHILNIGLMINPCLLAFILTAYAVIFTFLVGDRNNNASNENLKDTKRSITTNFAACLIITSFSIILMAIVSCIANMNLSSEYHHSINNFIFFIISFLLFFPIRILINVVIDIFNCTIWIIEE